MTNLELAIILRQPTAVMVLQPRPRTAPVARKQPHAVFSAPALSVSIGDIRDVEGVDPWTRITPDAAGDDRLYLTVVNLRHDVPRREMVADRVHHLHTLASIAMWNYGYYSAVAVQARRNLEEARAA